MTEGTLSTSVFARRAHREPTAAVDAGAGITLQSAGRRCLSTPTFVPFRNVAETATRSSGTSTASTCTRSSSAANDNEPDVYATLIPTSFHRFPVLEAPVPASADAAYFDLQMRQTTMLATRTRHAR